MKYTFFIIAFFAILSSCNTENKPAEVNKINSDTMQTATVVKDTVKQTQSSSIKELLSSYLQMKNAFTNDNGNEAASAGSALAVAFKSFDESSLSSDKKKSFDDIKDDAGEHAEHIGKNAANIKHQREHFDMLSKDMYDMVKTFGGGQTLYYDHCPMYNDNKGANWLSETKEIKNPYLGKKMPACGIVKEELK